MGIEADSHKKAALSDYLAVERTLLAWIRTGLALMGFGFVVARFGLFLQRFLTLETKTPARHSYGLSLWFGTALLLAGIVVNVLAAWRHMRLVRALDSGEAAHPAGALHAVAVALFLAVAGVVIVVFLISVRDLHS